MDMVKRFRTTAVIIAHALFPSWNNAHLAQRVLSQGTPDCRSVIPDDIPFIMANPGCAVNGSGELALFFPGCLSLAAPFLLMRLKRTGFSRCQAVADAGGIVLTARR
jgi:hypothetical protein